MCGDEEIIVGAMQQVSLEQLYLKFPNCLFVFWHPASAFLFFFFFFNVNSDSGKKKKVLRVSLFKLKHVTIFSHQQPPRSLQ